MPGIRRGNEDSHGNENQKLQKKYFQWEKIDKTLFSMKIKMMDLNAN